jgi:hypothetical protein
MRTGARRRIPHPDPLRCLRSNIPLVGGRHPRQNPTLGLEPQEILVMFKPARGSILPAGLPERGAGCTQQPVGRICCVWFSSEAAGGPVIVGIFTVLAVTADLFRVQITHSVLEWARESRRGPPLIKIKRDSASTWTPRHSQWSTPEVTEPCWSGAEAAAFWEWAFNVMYAMKIISS